MLRAARGLAVVRRVARADRIVQLARVAHVAQVAREVQEVREVAHRLVPTVLEVALEVVQADPEADLSKDAAANKNVVDVSRKSCSHKSWQRIRQSTPQYLRVKLLLSEAQQHRK